ncbi:hypothetical protein MTR67_006681, partial [Solanum verrucosum]
FRISKNTHFSSYVQLLTSRPQKKSLFVSISCQVFLFSSFALICGGLKKKILRGKRHLVVEKNRTIFQDNFVWPIEVSLIGRFCLPKSRCIVETVRKCQLVYYAYNYKKVDEQGFKLTLLQVLMYQPRLDLKFYQGASSVEHKRN